jgi:hypothetical protein
LQVALPAESWYWPAVQSEQEVCAAAEMRPASQDVHEVAPAAEYVPAAHASEANELMPVKEQ